MNTTKEYVVTKIPESICLTDPCWMQIPSIAVDVFPWKEYYVDIKTTVKVARTDTALLLRYETDERPLRAVNTEQNSPVCQDSCMEFFFQGG